MKTKWHLMALIAFLMLSCAGTTKTIVPGKNYVTKKVHTGSFKGISTSTSIDVLYTQTAGSRNVEVYAPDNLMEYIKVEVKNDVLAVRIQSKDKKGLNIRGTHKIKVLVSAPAVSELRTSSSGDIILQNGLKTDGEVRMHASSSGDIKGGEVVCTSLSLTASSSGDVVLDKVSCASLNADANSSGDVKISEVTAESVNAQADSSGDIILSGITDTANLSASSSGNVSAQRLKANQVTAKASSSGDVSCHAVESLNATVSSSGSINYKGNPKHIDFHPKRGLKKID